MNRIPTDKDRRDHYHKTMGPMEKSLADKQWKLLRGYRRVYHGLICKGDIIQYNEDWKPMEFAKGYIGCKVEIEKIIVWRKVKPAAPAVYKAGKWYPIKSVPHMVVVLLADSDGYGIGWRTSYGIHEMPDATHWSPLPKLPKAK